MADKPWLYEFLYRGRAPNEEAPAAWHIIVARSATNPFTNEAETAYKQYNIEEAIKAGYSLPDVLADINHGINIELDNSNKAIETLNTTLVEKQTECDKITSEANILVNASVARIKILENENTALKEAATTETDLKTRVAVLEAQIEVYKSMIKTPES